MKPNENVFRGNGVWNGLGRRMHVGNIDDGGVVLYGKSFNRGPCGWVL